uniref:Uncharacterized protein n=1 Tax=Globisporangium ultimum (strain ATCC 200006 / CBS 805.95 / DAOM BR144) TaxID=431595 RepID=K3WF68_GLOUD
MSDMGRKKMIVSANKMMMIKESGRGVGTAGVPPTIVCRCARMFWISSRLSSQVSVPRLCVSASQCWKSLR